ncbi:pumilio protein 4 [Trypanosoma conorhini]|uniref:Pumilio protein 4 n=1 Tax=Trypanosoma conorhini TaxID=83891 RepID=A0A422Q8Q1_9TRYP|nr:pumilio protein 4 [Trypanosoma conorhini]RNF26352.1 pumilio protein 4 [Trypanosoma conorhini]
MEEESGIAWNLSSLLAEVAAVRAAREGDGEEDANSASAAAPVAAGAGASGQFLCGERKAGAPHRGPAPLPVSFCSLAADVGGEAARGAVPVFFDAPASPAAGGWVSAAATAHTAASSCGAHTGAVAASPENPLKTPSSSPYSVVAGLTPSAHSASAARPSFLPATGAAATTSATSTPFGMAHSVTTAVHGVSLAARAPIPSSHDSNNKNNNAISHVNGSHGASDPLSSLNLLLNLSPVNAPIGSTGASAVRWPSPQPNNLVLSGGPYTLQQQQQQQQHVGNNAWEVGNRGGCVVQQQQQQQKYTERHDTLSDSLRGALIRPLPLVKHAAGCHLAPQGSDNPTTAATASSKNKYNNKNNKSNSNRNTANNSGRGSDYSWTFPEEGWSSLKSSSPSAPLRDLASFLGSKRSSAPTTQHPPHRQPQQQQGTPLVSLFASCSGEINRPSLASSERRRSPPVDASVEPHRDAVFPRVPFQLSLHRGYVVEMASDQHGCRELQSVLERFPYHSREVQCIVTELLPGLPQVMANPYGNFLVQKLLEIAPDEDRLQMLSEHLSGSLCEVAVSPHGNYAVQKLIDSLRSRREVEVVCAALQRGVLLLVNDLNGGHVVQKLLQCLPHDIVFVYDAIVEMTLAVCNDKQGCCVVQKCMDAASPEQLLRLQEAVLQHVLPLSTNPYGNYVVAHLIRHCNSVNQRQVVDRAAACVGPALKVLCTNKFASNVVETILNFCSEALKVRLCQFLLQEPDEKASPLLNGGGALNHQHAPSTLPAAAAASQQMLHHAPSILSTVALNEFGNYVVQKMLAVLPVCAELIQLIHHLHRLLPLLLEMNFGKRVEAKMEQAKARITQHYQQKGIAASDAGNYTAALGRADTTMTAMAQLHSARAAADADASRLPQQQRRLQQDVVAPVAPAVTVAAPPASHNSDKGGVGYNTNSNPLFVLSPTPRGTPQQHPMDLHQQSRQPRHSHGARSRNRREQRAKRKGDRGPP